MKYTNLFAGTCGWSFDGWVGTFYPEFTPKDKYLELYSEKFRAVEIRSTTTKLPSPDSISRWRARTPDEFKFAVVAPHSFSHDTGLRGIDRELNRFLKLCELLGGKLGPVVFEFPPQFNIGHLPEMTSFIKALPSGFQFVFEMNNRGWLHELFLDHLRERDIGMCQGNIPWAARMMMPETSNTVYITLRGRGRKSFEDCSKLSADEKRTIMMWASNAASWAVEGRPVYAFFGNNFEGHAPASASRFVQITEKKIEALAGK